jgi:hypothetical protein
VPRGEEVLDSRQCEEESGRDSGIDPERLASHQSRHQEGREKGIGPVRQHRSEAGRHAEDQLEGRLRTVASDPADQGGAGIAGLHANVEQAHDAGYGWLD